MPDMIIANWEFWYGVIGIIISAHFMDTMTTRPNRWHFMCGVIGWPLLVFLWIEVYCKQGEEHE
jgi:hypothetical protein